VPIAPEPTLADGLGGNLEPGSVTFELVRDHVDEVTVAEEDEIVDAVRFMVSGSGLVVEGAAGAAVAAARAGRVRGAGGAGTVVVVVTGRNIAAARLAGVLGSGG
jgi:threonine dehydratase